MVLREYFLYSKPQDFSSQFQRTKSRFIGKLRLSQYFLACKTREKVRFSIGYPYKGTF